MALLEVNDIHTYYDKIHALKGISLTVEEGEIVCLIGANGAGKTTTLRAISGLIKPRQGNIVLQGEDTEKYAAHDLVFKGIAMVPEGRGVFSKMSVLENLEMGAYHRDDKDGIAEDMQPKAELNPPDSSGVVIGDPGFAFVRKYKSKRLIRHSCLRRQ